MPWIQRQLTLPPFRRGFHLITQPILSAIPELATFDIGLLHIFIQHTSASITINENSDPDVRIDMETATNRIVPENQSFVHTLEGSDDMPAHVKSSLFGAETCIPVRNGTLALGTWQGIYLCEHRNRAAGRSLIITLNGE